MTDKEYLSEDKSYTAWLFSDIGTIDPFSVWMARARIAEKTEKELKETISFLNECINDMAKEKIELAKQYEKE